MLPHQWYLPSANFEPLHYTIFSSFLLLLSLSFKYFPQDPVANTLQAWIFVSFNCCVLCRSRPLRRAGHYFRGVLAGLCVCVCVCVCVCLIVCRMRTSTMRRSRPDLDCCVIDKKSVNFSGYTFIPTFPEMAVACTSQTPAHHLQRIQN